MLKFEIENKRDFYMSYSELDDDPIYIHLISSSVTNKYHIITGFIEHMCDFYGDEFSCWYYDFIYRIIVNNENRFDTIMGEIDNIKYYCDKYIDESGIDFARFVNIKKVKRDSILFSVDELSMIIKFSSYMKLYSLIFNSVDYKLSSRSHKIIYNELVSELLKTNIITKLFDVIKTKTFRYNITDRYMWDYIKMVQCKTIDVHIVEIFNFITNSIIVLCEEDKNPIIYFTTVVDESVKWVLRSIYKSSVVYEDSIATENLNSLMISNLNSYSYNETLGRLKGIAYEYIFKQLEYENDKKIDILQNTDAKITEFQKRIDSIHFMSPIVECLVYPVLAKTLNIPYTYFYALPPSYAAIISFYLYSCMIKLFKTEYKSLIGLLQYYPITEPTVATTYRLKQIQKFGEVFSGDETFYGFNTKYMPYNILSFYVGRLTRCKMRHLMTNKIDRLSNIDIEDDMIKFYHTYFVNTMDDKFQELAKIIHAEY